MGGSPRTERDLRAAERKTARPEHSSFDACAITPITVVERRLRDIIRTTRYCRADALSAAIVWKATLAAGLVVHDNPLSFDDSGMVAILATRMH